MLLTPMELFDVPPNCRVKLTAKLIRWVDHRAEHNLGEHITFEATTTDRYFTYKGARRRLLIDHTLNYVKEYGIWQKNTDCEVIHAECPE